MCGHRCATPNISESEDVLKESLLEGSDSGSEAEPLVRLPTGYLSSPHVPF